jgi:hypothetical protein
LFWQRPILEWQEKYMNANNRLLVFTAAFALLVVPPSAALVDAKSKGYYRHYVRKHGYLPARRAVDGSLVDREGWRLRPGYGWDNTCFHLDYLDSQFACSNNRR